MGGDPRHRLGNHFGRDATVADRTIHPDHRPAIGMQDVHVYWRVLMALHFDEPVASAVEFAHVIDCREKFSL